MLTGLHKFSVTNPHEKYQTAYYVGLRCYYLNVNQKKTRSGFANLDLTLIPIWVPCKPKSVHSRPVLPHLTSSLDPNRADPGSTRGMGTRPEIGHLVVFGRQHLLPKGLRYPTGKPVLIWSGWHSFTWMHNGHSLGAVVKLG